MSLLGKVLRSYLTAQTGYAATIPGGISPEVTGTGLPLPFVHYAGVSRQRTQLVGNTSIYYTERVTFACAATTRSGVQTVVDWITSKIALASTRTVMSGVTVHTLRVDDEGDIAEFLADGADEPVRTTTVDVIGSYEIT